jgi:DHA3 family tetracycline resistance protein-like MFS transporter
LRYSKLRLGAYPAYLILQGGYALAFSLVVTVNLIWQAEVAGLNALQLVLVGTLLETTTLLAEVPTGVVADVYSRRLSIVIGVFLSGAGFLLEGTVPRFEAILLAQVIWGIGATCLSGATEAWISDEIGQGAAGRAFQRGAQVRQITTLIAIPLSVALASLRLNVPIIVGANLMLALGCILVLTMPETGFIRPENSENNRTTLHAMTRTLREGVSAVRAAPVVLTLLLMAAFFGMTSEGFDRLWTIHVLQDFTFPAVDGLDSVAWFGVMRAGALVLSIVGTEAARRWLNTSDGRAVARALFAGDALRIACVAIFGLTSNFGVSVAAFWGASVLRQVNRPIYTAWLNQRLESATRATVLSMGGQMDALGQIVGGPAVGAIGLVSLRAAIVLTGALLAPVLLLYVRAAHQWAVAEWSRWQVPGTR